MKKKKDDNYLDYIPHKKDVYDREITSLDKEYIDSIKGGAFYIDDDKKVTILIENTGIMNRIAQKTLKKPRITHIHLEEIGSFIWLCIDGEKTIYTLGKELKSQFKDEIEPLYERLISYMRILENNEFIYYSK